MRWIDAFPCVTFLPLIMPGKNLKERWQQGVVAVGGALKRGAPQFIGFDVFFRILGFVFFAPLMAWLSARLIARSGSGAISNYDLTGFFLSVNGMVYLTVVVSLFFVLTFFKGGGMVALAIAVERKGKVRLPNLVWFLGCSLPRLWRLAVRQFLIYLAHAVPSLLAAGGAYLVFLTQSDIYYYLTVKPAEYWYAVLLAGAAGLAFTFFALRLFIDWIFSVPLLLLTSVAPREALKESKALAKGRRGELVLLLAGWGLAVVLLELLLWLIMMGLKAVLLGVAGKQVALVLAMTSVIAVVHYLLAAAVGIVAVSALACVVARSFMTLRPDVSLPDSMWGGEQALFHRITGWLRAGWVLVLVLAVSTSVTGLTLLNRVTFEDTTGITAHRGSSITAPENTMAAILLAVEEGADYVEIDVQETADGVLVLCHDKDLKRVFDINQGIWEVTYDEIKDLDSGGWFSPDFSDQRIATLAQVIEAVQGRAKLNIEMKFSGHEQKLASEVVRVVNEHAFRDQCILTSLDYSGLQRAQAADPQMRTGLIVTSAIGDITKLDADLLSVGAKSVSRSLIARAHEKDLEVHVWTVNEIADMSAMIGLGVDQIITDDPKLLGEVLAERGEMGTAEKLLLQLADFTSGR